MNSAEFEGFKGGTARKKSENLTNMFHVKHLMAFELYGLGEYFGGLIGTGLGIQMKKSPFCAFRAPCQRLS